MQPVLLQAPHGRKKANGASHAKEWSTPRLAFDLHFNTRGFTTVSSHRIHRDSLIPSDCTAGSHSSSKWVSLSLSESSCEQNGNESRQSRWHRMSTQLQHGVSSQNTPLRQTSTPQTSVCASKLVDEVVSSSIDESGRAVQGQSGQDEQPESINRRTAGNDISTAGSSSSTHISADTTLQYRSIPLTPVLLHPPFPSSSPSSFEPSNYHHFQPNLQPEGGTRQPQTLHIPYSYPLPDSFDRLDSQIPSAGPTSWTQPQLDIRSQDYSSIAPVCRTAFDLPSRSASFPRAKAQVRPSDFAPHTASAAVSRQSPLAAAHPGHKQSTLPFISSNSSSRQSQSSYLPNARRGRLSPNLPPSANTSSYSHQPPQPSQTYSAGPRLPAYYEYPTCTWADFQLEWRIHITTSEQDLAAKAKLGHLSAYTPLKMAAEYPTFEECDTLAEGLRTSGHRVTVDRLKLMIRGINANRNVQSITGHLKISGSKSELLQRVIDAVKLLRTRRSDEYFSVAKMIGEAQGYSYSAASASAPTSSNTAANASVSPYMGNSNVPAANANTSYASNGSTSYASRPAQFNLSRQPSTTSASTVYTAGPPHTARLPQAPTWPSSSTQSNYDTYKYGQPASQPVRSTGSSSYSYAPHGGNATASTSSVLYSGPSTSVNSLNQQVPTSWPTMPQKGALGNQAAIPISFKPSPFFEIIHAVSLVVTLQKALPGDRLTASAYIHLTDDQRQKLSTSRSSPSSSPQYQLRLYCTSADYYQPGRQFGSYGSAKSLALMEFPAACEANLNDHPLNANTKGIKKKAGTAPPPNVSSGLLRSGTSSANGKHSLDLQPGATNRLDLNYINTDKFHYMVVYLVESKSVGDLVDKVRRNKRRTKEETIKHIKRQAEDPDIVATSETISLKDPLLYVDMQTAIRSLHCVHLQCFDASNFFTMMEATPTWSCPVCNKVMDPGDLVHDGFYQDILDTVPRSTYDHVIVETDGSWRTEDNKHGTAQAVRDAALARAASVNVPDVIASYGNGHMSRDHSEAGTPLDTKPDVGKVLNGMANGRRNTPAEVIDLDDDEDDDEDDRIYGAGLRNGSQQISHKRLPSPASQRRQAQTQPGGGGGGGGTGVSSSNETGRGGGFIDLTLSSDDENGGGSTPVRPVEPNSGGAGTKRKAGTEWAAADDDENEYISAPTPQRARHA